MKVTSPQFFFFYDLHSGFIKETEWKRKETKHSKHGDLKLTVSVKNWVAWKLLLNEHLIKGNDVFYLKEGCSKTIWTIKYFEPSQYAGLIVVRWAILGIVVVPIDRGLQFHVRRVSFVRHRIMLTMTIHVSRTPIGGMFKLALLHLRRLSKIERQWPIRIWHDRTSHPAATSRHINWVTSSSRLLIPSGLLQ